jgi:predicted NAD/FAD-dependent oxidoreductase
MKTAVIGAGIAGLSAARKLVSAGADVTVFDKGRSPGGRTSTRSQSGFEFDHGAPSFTVTNGRFRKVIERAVQAGCVGEWRFSMAEIDTGRDTNRTEIEMRYVGIPRMNALARYFAHGIDVRPSTRVTEATLARGRWNLAGETIKAGKAGANLGEFDALVVAVPPDQAGPLLAAAGSVQDKLRGESMRPCWTVMAALDAPIDVPWDVATVKNNCVQTIIRNRAKPRRPVAETLVIHANDEWTARYLETSSEVVTVQITAEFEKIVGARLPAVRFGTAHRWRYARTSTPLSSWFIWDNKLQVGVCGDWCKGFDIESAFLSGLELSEKILCPEPE